MSFDPEKVRRENGVLGDANKHAGETEDAFVRASDYDQLLELYRSLREYANADPKLPQHLWSDMRYRAEASRQKQQMTISGRYGEITIK